MEGEQRVVLSLATRRPFSVSQPKGGMRVVPTATLAGSASERAPLTNLGFLTVLNEANGYLGGYLVTNVWGRPLEFRLSSAVQPNRVQNILYAATMEPYICADLIGKTLVDKTALPVQLLVTDRQPVLDLRHKLECPVLWLAASNDPRASQGSSVGIVVIEQTANRGSLLCHPHYPDDVASARGLISQLV